MVKVGEGGQVPQRPEEAYNAALQGNIVRFEQALNGYSTTGNPKEKAHFDDVMKQQMSLIRANVQEIKRSGIDKQAETVSNDFDRFSMDPTPENLTALQQDIGTLKEYGFLPE